MTESIFTNLMNEQNFSRINIDSRLVDSFKRVLDKLQTYFDANGYTSQRDYQKFFEDYLLKDMDSKLKMIVSSEPSKIGAAGFYRHRQGIAEIHIDELYLKKEELLDSIFCHEFIHFLAMRGLDDMEYPDPEIKNGGFINEALTEMLTQQIYPNSKAYQPQVDMLKFANLLTGNVNNYSRFLRGKVDCKGGASSWNNFFAAANAYQKTWKDKGFVMSQAINDPDYINAQQYIIRANIHPHLISSFDEYKKWISILQQRPAPDDEFIDKLYEEMDRGLIDKLGLKNDKLKDIMYRQLSEYRQLSSSFEMYEGKDVYEFEIAGKKVAIDKDRNLYGRTALGGYSSSWNPNTGIWELKVGNESIKLDVNTIDFGKRKRDLVEKEKSIPKYFSSTSREDIKSVLQVSQTEGLVKLEKFTLPIIGVNGKKVPTAIYVATYGDRIEILNHPAQIGIMENIKSSQYIGVTSQDPKVAAIYAKPMGSVDKGMVYSKFNEKYLTSKTIYSLAKKITPTLSQEQLHQLVEQYKLSDEFDPEESLTDAKVQEFAIMKYAKEQYYKMPEDERKKLFDEFANSQERFVISTKDGKVDVSLLFGSQTMTAFKGQSEVLIDANGYGLYNEHYELLSREKVADKKVDSEIIRTDSSGNIEYSTAKVIGDEVMEEARKTPEERLSEINSELGNLRQQYGQVATKIESLMKQNSVSPIANYQQQLNLLLQQRDNISAQMSPLMETQRVFQVRVEQEKEEKHEAILFQIEQLTGKRITGISGYAIDPSKYNGTPYPQLKNSSQLQVEHGEIAQQIDELYLEGKIDLKTKQAMNLTLVAEYKKLVANAPRPVKTPQNPTSNPPAPDEFEQTQRQFPTSNSPQQQPHQQRTEKVESFEEKARKKYGYDDMSPEEKANFDKDTEKAMKQTKKAVPDKTEKKELEEQRRNLRRQQFGQKLHEMGIDREQVANLDEIFRQQEIMDKMRAEQEELENTEGFGMHM